MAGWGKLSFLVLPALALLLGAGSAVPASAESVLERVARTGVLNAGTRDHIRPFAYRDADGAFVGFSVDIIHAIHAALERQTGRSIKLEIAQVDAQSRIAKVADGTLDITCDIASKTWARDEVIDFSLTIFFNGTRILTERQFGLAGVSALQNKRIGVIANSSTITVMRRILPSAEIVPFADMNAAMAALEAGELDGISNISIILRGLQRRASQPGRYIVLPRADYLNAEPMACILPQNDSPWRDFVDHTLVRLMSGVEEYRGPYFDIYQKWFGPDGDLHYPLSQDAIRHFDQIRSWIDD
ncbi:MAG: amino acid ABC transporter substrate-binding protein [Alphaproteobacteria bacterium]|nr:amino acid ABC transporter substrate-binding protein [Alphaproteobacteria bacterium]MBU0798532.1 amino acid ABC transporter substrate-binding protein [Alphaproteobacteria bacterium]MBU0886188.1 amino acid ABC transporter substrate-binding protein [Alphaproteobacteria bacterium]MBU1812828.1 amino acid ABC transporter substrate-binding protein [Alphaproteobacteria bacterium]MBU2091071.1 amino acid ABC transporter substrate-binding protein [Alphaproteobacteria bacterium]